MLRGTRTWPGSNITEWPGFAEGAWWVQDLAASLPVRLLGAKPGESVLDLCAAPGGKTMQLAALAAVVSYFWRDVRGVVSGSITAVRRHDFDDHAIRRRPG